MPLSGGVSEGCGNELSQALGTESFRTTKFVSVLAAPVETNGVRRKRTETLARVAARACRLHCEAIGRETRNPNAHPLLSCCRGA